MNLQLGKIRRQVVRVLKAQESLAGPRVYGNRNRAVWRDQLPAILVYLLEEEGETRDESPRVYAQTAKLAITAFVPATPPAVGSPPREISADDLLEEVGDSIWEAIHWDTTLGGTAHDCHYKSTKIETLDPIGEVVMSAGRILFDVNYATEAGERCDPRGLFDLERVTYAIQDAAGRTIARDEEVLPPPPAAPPPGAKSAVTPTDRARGRR